MASESEQLFLMLDCMELAKHGKKKPKPVKKPKQLVRAMTTAQKASKKAASNKYSASHREEKKAYAVTYEASHKEERQAYRDSHKKRSKEVNAEYYQANKAKKNAANAAYYQANKEKIQAQQREYSLANKEKIAEQKNGYYLEHREEMKAYVKGYALDHYLDGLWNNISARTVNGRYEKRGRKNPRNANHFRMGIRIFDAWQDDKEAFIAWIRENLGERPKDEYGDWLSLDRIDNKGNYEPGNLRWATDLEQAANKGDEGKADAELLEDAARSADKDRH